MRDEAAPGPLTKASAAKPPDRLGRCIGDWILGWATSTSYLQAAGDGVVLGDGLVLGGVTLAVGEGQVGGVGDGLGAGRRSLGPTCPMSGRCSPKPRMIGTVRELCS